MYRDMATSITSLFKKIKKKRTSQRLVLFLLLVEIQPIAARRHAGFILSKRAW